MCLYLNPRTLPKIYSRELTRASSLAHLPESDLAQIIALHLKIILLAPSGSERCRLPA